MRIERRPPQRRSRHRRSPGPGSAVLACLLLGAGCGPIVDDRSPGGPASTFQAPTTADSPSPLQAATNVPTPGRSPRPGADRPSPPDGFPVFPGASSAPLPGDDLGVAARWTTGAVGAAPYDFYLAALPAGGFEVLGRYPGGAGAVILFRVAGDTWQVAIDPQGDRLRITLQLDRG